MMSSQIMLFTLLVWSGWIGFLTAVVFVSSSNEHLPDQPKKFIGTVVVFLIMAMTFFVEGMLIAKIFLM